jgi:hypothetical protein
MDKKDLIISTKNYQIFKHIKGNRKLNQRHLGRLVGSIGTKNLLQQNPIIVNEKFQIIDGQHRLEAAKRLGVDIWYTVVEGGELGDVQRVNTYTRPWKSIEYLRSYVELGKETYIKIEELLKTYDVALDTLFVFATGDSDLDMYDKFRDGVLTLNDEHFKQVEELLQVKDQLQPFFIDSGHKSRVFARVIKKLHREGLIDRLLEKTIASSPRFRRAGNVKEYLRMFEDVMNYNQKTNKVNLEGLSVS